MKSDPRQQQEIEKLVEAQARGEATRVKTEQEAPQDSELDKRVSKGDPYGGDDNFSGT